MALRGRLGDRQPEAGPGATMRTPEASECKLRLFSAKAGSFVCDREQRLPILRARLDRDPAAAVAARVLDQIRERTFERTAVAAHARWSGDKVDIGGLGGTRKLVQPDDLVRRCGRLLARECEEVVGESRQPPRVLLQLSDELVARSVARQVVDISAERSQRGAQLVRGIGEEASLRLARTLERAQHPVQGRGKLADLVIALRL